jgi:ketosteroid isomerase-like protein
MSQYLQAEDDIRAMVDRETAAWNRLDADSLVNLFHPDTVWPWPPNSSAHDPESWVMPLGRFNRARWKTAWESLFSENELVHNKRKLIRIQVSKEHDGAFAVVDVDTLWRNKATGNEQHWLGRSCKVYTKVNERWFFIYQTGLLEYPCDA